MSALKLPSRQTLHLLRSLSYAQPGCISQVAARPFSSSTGTQEEAQVQASKPMVFRKAIDPATVSSPRLERRLLRQKQAPIGSRRRRMALQGASDVPFEQLPYQCFQEARKVILADREEKLKEIETMRQRIARVKATAAPDPGAESRKQVRLRSMQTDLETLKIYADVNDPLVKKRFEDGLGDMSKPIYRYLADRKWREYRRKILMQRVTQMTVVPDILPAIDPVTDVRLFFNRHDVPPGQIVPSVTSEKSPRLSIQPFTRSTNLVTIAVIDADVPNLEKDGYGYRCHFLASNISVSPTSTITDLSSLSPTTQLLLPWLAPFSQKGIPYQRFATFILRQPDNLEIDIASTKTHPRSSERDGFNLRSFVHRHHLSPIGVHLFRSTWDEGTSGVMKRAGVEGEDLEFKRKKVEPLKYVRRNPKTMRG